MCSVCDCICCLPMNGVVDHRTPCVNFLRLRLLVLLPSSPHPPSFPPSAYSFSFTPSDLHLINCSLSFSLFLPLTLPSHILFFFWFSLSLSPLSPPPWSPQSPGTTCQGPPPPTGVQRPRAVGGEGQSRRVQRRERSQDFRLWLPDSLHLSGGRRQGGPRNLLWNVGTLIQMCFWRANFFSGNL